MGTAKPKPFALSNHFTMHSIVTKLPEWGALAIMGQLAAGRGVWREKFVTVPYLRRACLNSSVLSSTSRSIAIAVIEAGAAAGWASAADGARAADLVDGAMWSPNYRAYVPA